jgi:protein-S-isoprenylcysteine O-methyltransferase Ste14
MTLFLAKMIWVVGFCAFSVIRFPHLRRARRTPTARRVDRALERVLVGASALGQGILPAVYVFTGEPEFADYPFQPLLAWLGTVIFAGALYLFYCAHRDLARNWSVALEVRAQHSLITTGIYNRIRHPMYSAFLLSTVAQALLLPNWIAGLAGLVGFGIMFFGRLWREERMMIETFGDEYRRYMARTDRIIPGVF